MYCICAAHLTPDLVNLLDVRDDKVRLAAVELGDGAAKVLVGEVGGGPLLGPGHGDAGARVRVGDDQQVRGRAARLRGLVAELPLHRGVVAAAVRRDVGDRPDR
jgi:hypothetical protein